MFEIAVVLTSGVSTMFGRCFAAELHLSQYKVSLHFIFTSLYHFFSSLFTSDVQTRLKAQPGFVECRKINKNVFITAASHSRQIPMKVKQ